jgi:hypothetical protein
MCISTPKVPRVPPPAERQAMQMPKDMNGQDGKARLRRRGMFAALFTSPGGVTGAPTVTGGGGSMTGG